MQFAFCLTLFAFAMSSVAQATDPDAIFKKTINGILWLYNYVGEDVVTGSGVLIDKERRLFITNAHVLKDEQELGTFFPAWDDNGKLIVHRAFYEKSVAEGAQKNLRGRGRLAAIDKSKDLAIVQTDNVPKTARAITVLDDDHSRDSKKGDKIHILGNPAGRDLWQWSLASFESYFRYKDKDRGLNFQAIETYGTAYFGNSGGAMLDDEGRLVGVTQSISGEGLTKTYGVHVDEIDALLDSITLYWVFNLENNSGGFLDYTLKNCYFDEDEESDAEYLEEYYVASEGELDTHVCDGRLPIIEYSYSVGGEKVEKTFDVRAAPIYFGDGVDADPAYDGFDFEWKKDEKSELKIMRMKR